MLADLYPVGFRDAGSLERYAAEHGGWQPVEGLPPEKARVVNDILYVSPALTTYRNTLKSVSGVDGAGLDADHSLARSIAGADDIAFVPVGWLDPSVNRSVGAKIERNIDDYVLGQEHDGIIDNNPVSFAKSVGLKSSTHADFQDQAVRILSQYAPEGLIPLHQIQREKYFRGE